MALLGRDDILSALERRGELAAAESETVRLVIVGGAAMVLGFGARLSTHDVDVLFLAPPEASRIRSWASRVAEERRWPEDWLNDAAKAFLIGLSIGPTLLSRPGIEVLRPAAEQLLAMKLSAWRDDVDIADADRLLADLRGDSTCEEVWQRVLPFVVPGTELKAEYAFEDLWNRSSADT